MKPLSERELRMNQQAAMAAAAVLSEPVEAATRCEQVTRDMGLEAFGFGGIMRGMMRVNDAMNRATPGTIGKMTTQMQTAGLPNSFILAVTRHHVLAIEERQQGDDLVAGPVLKSWDRAGFVARRGVDRANAVRGVPDDRQVLTLFLPIEGGGNRYLQAAARNVAAAGAAGFPHQMMVAKDAPSQRVIDVLGATSGGAGPNIMIGSMSLQDIVAQQVAAGSAQPAPASTAQRLQDLEALRVSGAITDDEYAAKRQQIIAEL
jgi:hypothetical protein